MTAPVLFLVPRWACLALLLVTGWSLHAWWEADARAALEARSLTACEARAQASLVKASECSSLLTGCMSAVHKIADELQIERVEF